MRNVVGGLALILAIGTMAGCETPYTRLQVNVNWASDQQAAKSVGVLEFDWKPPELKLEPGISSGHMAEAGAIVSDMVASELMKLGRYQIRERSDLRRVLEEHQLQLSDLVAKGDFRRIGELAKVDAVIVGRVGVATGFVIWAGGKYEGSYTCRCVSTQTGDVLWSMGGDITVDATPKVAGGYWLRVLTENLVRDLKDKLDQPPPGAQGAKSGG